MMKTHFFYIAALLLLLIACKDDTEKLFDKTSEQRAAEAIQALKDDLTAPGDGWKLKYQPEDGSGSYWVLLHFFDDNKLVIETDLGSENGEYFTDTLTYRVDNSLGLELIFETYSFFSFLFEQDGATFLAEYEFLYANKTPDGSLVFTSKSDPTDKTTLLFEKASASDADLLGRDVATNITTISEDATSLIFSAPSYVLNYDAKDIALYLSMDPVKRVIDISSATRQSNSATASVNFTTGYYLQGDSLVFHDRFTGTYHGVNLNFKSVLFSNLSESTLPVCGGRDVHEYEGTTEQGDPVLLQSTLESPAGAGFANAYAFYVSPIEYIFENGENRGAQIGTDITGAGSLQLYLDDGFYALGFYILNADGTTTWALREFTPVITGNKIAMNFEPTISIYGNEDTPANIDNAYQYLDAFAQDGQTYMFEVEEGVYEMSNPCTGWSAAFIGIE
jgi:hypothetical protein